MQPKTITKTISLEQFKTRYPLCYPSLVGGEIQYLDTTSASTRTAFYDCIPLGVCEGITGNYSGFTQEMGEAYHGIVLFYHTLQEWFNEFRAYYKLIYSNECHGKFESASVYYKRTYPNISSDIGVEMDKTFVKHGGDKFYNWLIDNYFVTLDFYREYESVSGTCSYDRWVEIIDNLPTPHMPYPEAVSFMTKMTEWYDLYSGDTQCNESEDCCECVDYRNYGGDLMYNFLNRWVGRIRTNINTNNEVIKAYEKPEDLIPKAYIHIPINSKIENLGVLVSFSKEFVPGELYISGGVCTFEDEVYMCNVEEYQESEFIIRDDDTPNWIPYYDVYIKQHPDEKDDGSALSGVTFSGRTVSSLDFFTRKQDTVDVMGNTMPGYFKPNSGSTTPHPAEEEFLDLLYKPGEYANLEFLEESGNTKYYKCSLLERIKFFVKDYDGNEITSASTWSEIQETASTRKVIDDINECLSKAEEGFSYAPTLYADFHYCQNAIVTFSGTSKNSIIVDVSSGGCMSYIDHCTLEKSTCQYRLSETESYPVMYYQVQKDVEERYSDEYQETIRVCMCDFFLKPEDFGARKHSASPLMRREVFLPFVDIEIPVNNIYIDRGYATVLDRHLRIGEVSDYKQLEKYGNGIFQIFNSNEELV